MAMLSHPFIRTALVAGTSVAALSGIIGWFVVLRGQVFAGDALSHVAYTGALAALASGVDLRLGLFVATAGAGVALGLLGGRASADDVVIGTGLAWVLGLGVLFLTLFTKRAATAHGNANVAVLFGSIFGINPTAAVTAALLAAGLIVAVLVIARPLLFTSIDPAVAAAGGVPVRLLGPLFLALVGATTAETSQIVGALLGLGLLAAPAAAAVRLTDRPWPGIALSALLAVAAVWAGITLAYAVPTFPPSFTIMAVAAAEYLLAVALGQCRTAPRKPDPGRAVGRATASRR
ncbi:metal ABC transporter permease (plasmid) [Pseudonocardia alaniniphila]|uniref:Metal ABC transporter permease n=2 Tax=Pseudonocardia alaniniphila TaxID=75291 RepID=A0ABS9T722_9PSEU|nr:metal ABC transporter permease [Pseudonocardia alaniniphila]MCH6164325.1 metal ABC transporter permease [Pseudonocardia alaniniphila]